MKNKFILILVILVTIQGMAQNPFAWIDPFGIAGDNLGSDVFVTADAVYAGGWFESSITFDTITFNSRGMKDIFVVKLTHQGEVVWARQLGGPYDDFLADLLVDDIGNIYFSGSHGGYAYFGDFFLPGYGYADALVGRISIDGEVKWVLDGGGAVEDRAYRLALSPGKDFIAFTGFYREYGVFGQFSLPYSGTRTAYWAKADSSGQYEWVISSGNDISDQSGYGIAVDDANHIYIAGYFFSNIWEVGPFMLTNTAYGSADCSLIKLNEFGNVIWAKSFGGEQDDLPRPVYVKDDCLYIGGYHMGSGDFLGIQLEGTSMFTKDSFVIKADTAGTGIWGVSRFSDDANELIGMHLSDQYVYVTGGFTGNIIAVEDSLISHGEYDAYAMRINDQTGIPEKVITGGGSQNDSFFNISGHDNLLVSSGYFASVAYFGDEILHANGNTDIIVAAFTDTFVWMEETPASLVCQLYPNPCRDYCIIRFDNPDNQFCSIVLYDVYGHIVKEIYQPVCDNLLRIPCSDLSPGMYFLMLTDGRGKPVFAKMQKV